MTKTPTPTDDTPLTVFRPRRKCAKCGLVNSDRSPKCRRCGSSFAAVDPARESERLVERIRARRFIIAAVILTIVVGLVSLGFSYRSRLDRMSRYADLAQAVEADLTSIGRGAGTDARALLEAFDDADLRRLLRVQAGTWEARAAQTKAIDDQIDELVPQNEGQAAHELELVRKLSLLETTSRELAEASRDGDLFRARIAATRLAEAIEK